MFDPIERRAYANRTRPNGAESLVQTLVNSGVDLCFANPGTSEMHFLAALDRNDGIRCVLCLFEGVASAAADGYARMTGRPAATLLHLGPGLANAGANLHNAMRAGVPMVNIVGDHATPHRHLDAPLTSDIEAIARGWSVWCRTSRSAAQIAMDAAEAVEVATSGAGGIATLILPADTAWTPATAPRSARKELPRFAPEEMDLDRLAAVLRGEEPVLLLLGNEVLADSAALDVVDQIVQATGAEALAETSFSRIEAGAGRVRVESVPYGVDMAVERLGHFRHCILVGAVDPVAFFAYPGKPGRLLPEACSIDSLADARMDCGAALQRLVDRLGAGCHEPRHVARGLPRSLPEGPLTPEGIGASLANRLPDGAIISDEALTTGGPILSALCDAAPHSRLQLTGGAIGIGLPLAVGAAVACPDRQVVVLQADGSGMYTLQALWTQAREGLNVVSIVLSNRAYEILKYELGNVGVTKPGPKALEMTSLTRPDLDWVSLAQCMGVPGGRASSAAEFDALLAQGFATDGPFLIEADLV